MVCLFFAVLPALMPISALHAGQVAGLFVTPRNAAAISGDDRRALLVDVRSHSDFESIHIPGSIHVPLHFVKTRDHLKHRTIVLVDRGFSTRHLVRACIALNKSGFDVRILAGGLNAWVQNDLSVTGDPFEARAISRVSPADVFQELPAGTFLPVDISGTRDRAGAGIPFNDALDLDATSEDFIRDLARHASDDSRHAILFFNRAGTGYESVYRKAMSAGVPGAFFFLEGGLEAWNSYREHQRRANAPKSRHTISINRISCSNCND